MKKILWFFRSRAAVFAHDLLMVPLAWFCAYWLRFNLDSIPEEFFRQALLLLPIVWIMQGVAFWYFGLYRGIWRFASIPDLMRIIKAVTAGVVVAATVSFILTRLLNVPRSVFVLDGILLVLLLGGPRFLYRWYKDRNIYRRVQDRHLNSNSEIRNTLIVGAGKAGEMLVRDLLRESTGPYRLVAFVEGNAIIIRSIPSRVAIIGISSQRPTTGIPWISLPILLALSSTKAMSR